jgi:hypothetical protein
VRVQLIKGVYSGVYTYSSGVMSKHVDDVVVKTQEDGRLISDLAETFDNSRKFKMKLNREKCTFRVPLGKLLGYMAS